MFHILEEDLDKLYPSVKEVIRILSSGIRRAEMPVTIGEDLPAFQIVGYWIQNGIRLDIRVEK